MKGRKSGTPKTGGREVGTPNKTTKEIREFYLAFLSKNIEQVQTIFDEVVKDNPVKALEHILKISQFMLPSPPPEPIESETDKNVMVYIVHPPKEDTD